MHPLIVGGIAIEVIGVLVAGSSFYRMYRHAAPAGYRPWSGPFARLRRTIAVGASRFEAAVRKMIQRPKNISITAGPMEFGASFGAGARITTTFPRLLRLGDHEARLLELHDRTNTLLRKIEDLEYRLFTEKLASDERMAAIESQLNDEVRRIEQAQLQDALKESQWQLTGLVLVLVGIVVQSVGQALQATGSS